MIATGLAGGADRRADARAARRGVDPHTTSPAIAGESRTNLAVIDPTSGEQTEINERGPEVTRGGGRALHRAAPLPGPAARSICVLAGSLPPGRRARALRRADRRELRERAASSSSSTPRASRCAPGCGRGPSVVAPNVREAEEPVGHEFERRRRPRARPRRAARAGRRARRSSPARRAASRSSASDARAPLLRGRDRAARAGRGGRLRRRFLAGYVAARYDGPPAEECLAYGVACGAESTQHFGAGSVDPDQVERILRRVEVRELEVPREVGEPTPRSRVNRSLHGAALRFRLRKAANSRIFGPAAAGFFRPRARIA